MIDGNISLNKNAADFFASDGTSQRADEQRKRTRERRELRLKMRCNDMLEMNELNSN